MKYDRPPIDPALIDELTTDAQNAGFTSLRNDASLSRWTYLRKLLALGRQYKDVLKAN